MLCGGEEEGGGMGAAASLAQQRLLLVASGQRSSSSTSSASHAKLPKPCAELPLELADLVDPLTGDVLGHGGAVCRVVRRNDGDAAARRMEDSVDAAPSCRPAAWFAALRAARREGVSADARAALESLQAASTAGELREAMACVRHACGADSVEPSGNSRATVQQRQQQQQQLPAKRDRCRLGRRFYRAHLVLLADAMRASRGEAWRGAGFGIEDDLSAALHAIDRALRRRAAADVERLQLGVRLRAAPAAIGWPRLQQSLDGGGVERTGARGATDSGKAERVRQKRQRRQREDAAAASRRRVRAGLMHAVALPVTGKYRLRAAGASGGGFAPMQRAGGRGAVLQAEWVLRKGDVLTVLCGGAGCGGGGGGDDFRGSSGGGGGGGGTFVSLNGRQGALLVAGGGGGAGGGAERGVDGQHAPCGTVDGAAGVSLTRGHASASGFRASGLGGEEGGPGGAAPDVLDGLGIAGAANAGGVVADDGGGGFFGSGRTKKMGMDGGFGGGGASGGAVAGSGSVFSDQMASGGSGEGGWQFGDGGCGVGAGGFGGGGNAISKARGGGGGGGGGYSGGGGGSGSGGGGGCFVRDDATAVVRCSGLDGGNAGYGWLTISLMSTAVADPATGAGASATAGSMEQRRRQQRKKSWLANASGSEAEAALAPRWMQVARHRLVYALVPRLSQARLLGSSSGPGDGADDSDDDGCPPPGALLREQAREYGIGGATVPIEGGDTGCGGGAGGEGSVGNALAGLLRLGSVGGGVCTDSEEEEEEEEEELVVVASRIGRSDGGSRDPGSSLARALYSDAERNLMIDVLREGDGDGEDGMNVDSGVMDMLAAPTPPPRRRASAATLAAAGEVRRQRSAHIETLLASWPCADGSGGGVPRLPPCSSSSSAAAAVAVTAAAAAEREVAAAISRLAQRAVRGWVALRQLDVGASDATAVGLWARGVRFALAHAHALLAGEPRTLALLQRVEQNAVQQRQHQQQQRQGATEGAASGEGDGGEEEHGGVAGETGGLSALHARLSHTAVCPHDQRTWLASAILRVRRELRPAQAVIGATGAVGEGGGGGGGNSGGEGPFSASASAGAVGLLSGVGGAGADCVEVECLICLEDLPVTKMAMAVFFVCGHHVCVACFGRLVGTELPHGEDSHRCPACRGEILREAGLWVATLDESGRTFFLNSRTEERSWRRPASCAPHWERLVDGGGGNGDVYYFNRTTGEKTWDRPVGGVVIKKTSQRQG